MSRAFKYAGRGKRDVNHKAISDAFLTAGWRVVDLSMVGGGCPDLLVAGWGHPLRFVEIKRDRRATLTPKQQAFWRDWPVQRVETVDDVIQLIQRER